MRDVVLYPTKRQGGKTFWLQDQAGQAVRDGKNVATVVASMAHRINIPGDVYSEATFEHARGRQYDHIYVDNADLFQAAPAELCARIAHGVPVTMTYTPRP